MIPHWLYGLSLVSLVTAGLGACAIAVDLVRHPQKMGIMNVTWPITALYFGVPGLWAYFAFGREAAKSGAAKSEKPFWQSVFVGVTHCGGGCTLGDILAEWAIFGLGWTIAGVTLWPEMIGDFALAYLFGIVFQYFAIAPMRHLPPGQGIWAAVKADTLSLTAFEVGLFGWMALTYFVAFQPHLKPSQPEYWLMMQIGMVIGFATSYPMNWWLIKKGIKEPM